MNESTARIFCDEWASKHSRRRITYARDINGKSIFVAYEDYFINDMDDETYTAYTFVELAKLLISSL